MSIRRYRNDNPRDADEVAAAIESELQRVRPTAPVVEGTQNYAFIRAFGSTIAAQQEQSLAALYDAGFLTDADGEELTKKAREYGVRRQSAVAATGVIAFQRDSPAGTDYVIPIGTTVGTGGDDNVTFKTTTATTIEGPTTQSDGTAYTTSSGSYVVKTSFDVDARFRESLNVSLSLATDDATYTAFAEVQDVTTGVEVAHFETTNTSLTNKSATYDLTDINERITLEFQIRIGDTSATATLDEATVNAGGEVESRADIRCTDTGPVGNIGANTITVLVSGDVSGVDTVTNPNSTGNRAYTLTDGQTAQTVGQSRESDESLRDRALDASAIGGAGSAEAVELAMENIPEVISADVFTNRSDATTNGIDPWNTEVRVFGGTVTEIANRLYEVLPLITLKTLQGGANGTKETATIDRSELYGELTIPITRPTQTALTLEVDIVHTETYAGTDVVKDAIVTYVGGQTTDARTLTGLGQGSNVLVNEIENVAEDQKGVEYANVTLLDADGDGTDDTTTDADGVPVYSVGDSEVAQTDAADITLTETER